MIGESVFGNIVRLKFCSCSFDGCDMLDCKLWKESGLESNPGPSKYLSHGMHSKGVEASLHADNSQVYSLTGKLCPVL